MPPARYRGIHCDGRCLEIRTVIAGESGELRIPIPTGHRLDASSVQLGEVRVPVFETRSGGALLRLEGGSRRLLEYRTGPAVAPAVVESRRSRASHPELAAAAEDLRRLPPGERVRRATGYVAGRIVYDRRPAAAEAYAGGGKSFVATALEVGAPATATSRMPCWSSCYARPASRPASPWVT